MDITTVLSALHTLCGTFARVGARISPRVLMQLGRLCLALFTAIGQLVAKSNDPRLVLAHAELVEGFAQQVHHEQLSVAVCAETTGAHALSVAAYDRLRQGECDYEQEPERVSGRTCYQSPADVLAAWLGINYFEAQRRIQDAHLLVARRTAQGTRAPARFTHLAEVYSAGTVDRRRVAKVARQLEKLEPADTIFDGEPLEPSARAADGLPLEAHAARALRQSGPHEAQKHIGDLLKEHRTRTANPVPPPTGLFLGRQRAGTQEFILRTTGSDTQVLLSVIAQADDPRSPGGQAARTAAQERHRPQTEETAGQPADAGSCPEPDTQAAADPGWLSSTEPMPAWAAAEEPAAHEDTGPEAAAPEGENQTPAAEQHEAEATVPQRRLNAVMNLLSTPVPGGKVKRVVPKVIVYMWLKDLQDLASAHGMTSNGVDIPPAELRCLLARSRIIPMVLGGNSQPLDVGRSRRFHQGYVRMAVMARDRGCIVPDCTRAPDHSEIDHYEQPWSDGGSTSVSNGAAVCPDGHHSRHVGHIEIVDIDGLPHVKLPKHIDPEQKPRRNTYWGALQLGDAPQDDPAVPGRAPESEPPAAEPPAQDDPPTDTEPG